MMPQWTCESPCNESRAAVIATTLLEQNFDILCLQKVFDRSAKDVLERALAARYPHRYGPANDGCSLLLNSGVWVLSRHPLADYQQIKFCRCDGLECYSRKGAVLLSGTCGQRTFRLVTTHLQGEEGPNEKLVNQPTRDEQMIEIWERLVAPHLEASTPFIFCGDLGTPRFMSDLKVTTFSYERMLSVFGAENGPETRITLIEAKSANQLATDDTGWKNEMDYILVRPNGSRVTARRERHVFRRGGWDTSGQGRVDLSYRYGVSARITIE